MEEGQLIKLKADFVFAQQPSNLWAHWPYDDKVTRQAVQRGDEARHIFIGGGSYLQNAGLSEIKWSLSERELGVDVVGYHDYFVGRAACFAQHFFANSIGYRSDGMCSVDWKCEPDTFKKSLFNSRMSPEKSAIVDRQDRRISSKQ